MSIIIIIIITSCGSVGLKLGLCGWEESPDCKLILSFQCGLFEVFGGVHDDDDPIIDGCLFFVTNAGSVVICQCDVCGMAPAALQL